MKDLENITKGEWFPFQFGGYWQILNGNYYDSDDILDSENVGEPQAGANAKLMAMAPVLATSLQDYKDLCEAQKKLNVYLTDFKRGNPRSDCSFAPKDYRA